MSSGVSALQGIVDVDGYVDISEAGPQGMIALRGDLASAEVGKAAALTGCALPQVRRISHAGAMSLAWMSPDELLILCPYGAAPALAGRMQEALGDAHALVANVSDARAMFRLGGADVREVLAKLAPVDLSPDAFAPGMIRRTRLAQVAAAFHLRDETTCEIVCFRSVAHYVFQLLRSVSRKGGEVGYF